MALEGVIKAIVFPDKASVWIIALIYDEDKALADPTSVKVSLSDPDGGTLILDKVSMTKYEATVGIYEYFYHKGDTSAAMALGQWTGEIMTIDGSGATAVVSVQPFSFEVK